MIYDTQLILFLFDICILICSPSIYRANFNIRINGHEFDNAIYLVLYVCECDVIKNKKEMQNYIVNSYIRVLLSSV